MIVVAGLTLAVAFAAAADPVGITRYTGLRFPYSAGFWTAGYERDAPAIRTIRRSCWIDQAGTGSVSHYFGAKLDYEYSNSGYTVSAVDPTVLYVEDYDGIRVFRIADDRYSLLHTILSNPPTGPRYYHCLPARLDRNGGDILYLATADYAFSVAVDTNGDRIADTMIDRDSDGHNDHLSFGRFSLVAVDNFGTAYLLGSEERPDPPYFMTVIYTVLDTDNDLIPDTRAWPENPGGRADLPQLDGFSYYADLDPGAGRLVLNPLGFPFGVVDLDGGGFPIGTSYHLVGSTVESGSPPYASASPIGGPVFLHDGSMAGDWYFRFYDSTEPNDGVHLLTDDDFDGRITIAQGAPYGEIHPALTVRQFDPVERSGSLSIPELSELHPMDGQPTTAQFSDFGIWPDGRAFSFRQAGVERTSVDVSANGLLSFVGPVTASPSLATLEATPGLVAPAWSDQWDTSQVRVFAGCAPVQRRFADGSGTAALSFVVEWRGLISPNGKRTSLRCLLLQDGSFRVDYGAMEIDSMPLVVGYSTDGAGAIVTDDLSDSSWGGSPAGTLDESALGEEFGSAKPFDLAHKWIRFSGYGDVRGPRPELIDVVLKGGKKIQMRATGSNIQPDASLLVDGSETFELQKSASGSKWAVTKKAVSTPGAKSVASIWADGAAHSIVVVNPDGGRSSVIVLR